MSDGEGTAGREGGAGPSGAGRLAGRGGRGGPTWRLLTPAAARSAAIAVVQVRGEVGQVDAVVGGLGIAPVAVGRVAHRSFGGIDPGGGVVARVSDRCVLLMPHAGPAVLKGLFEALARLGVGADESDDPRDEYPEAGSLLEAHMMRALARAASPLAVDLLLDQPRRWGQAARLTESCLPEDPADDAGLPARSALLNRLIDPPLVVAIGPPNIGKSTLLNTLAHRGVALVADEPGTTRDHVGVTLDLAGLTVHYIDTPGMEAGGAGAGARRDPIQDAAQALALQAAAGANLILMCGDRSAGFLENPVVRVLAMRVALRADLGQPAGEFDAAVSARTGSGIEALVRMIRDRLVPPEALNHPGPWRFW